MVDEDILRRFGHVWPRHVASLTHFLIECRRHFGGDIDLFLVLCIIGDRTFSARHAPPDMTYETWDRAKLEKQRIIDINIQSIADYSGIPRETVRRKMNDLLARGWVTRDERGYLSATDKAKNELEPLTMVSLRYLSDMKTVLSGTGQA